jgi:hypothetical protein
MILFDPGKILMTPGALAVIQEARQKPSQFVLRHVKLEQGELDASDHRLNLSAVKSGLRIFSSFTTAKGAALWLISEWVDIKAGANPRMRELTTILEPSDY